MPTLLTLVAMDKEGKDFADKNGFLRSEKRLTIPEIPAEIYEREIFKNNHEILIISGSCPLHGVNRIGPSINLLALTAIQTFKPDYLINAGFAGGFKKQGAEIGDIYLGSGNVFSHDRFFTEEDAYKNYCEGGFPVSYSEDLAKAMGAKRGQITSSGSMLTTHDELKNMERFGTVVKDMESAALAEVAFLMQVKFVAIKIITDLVDHSECSQAQFNQNYPGLVVRLHEAMSQIRILES